MVIPLGGTVTLAVTDPDPDFEVIGSDLEFIFDQIRISEHHAADWLAASPADRPNTSPLCESYGSPTLPADTSGTCVPSPMLPWGLRTVDGSFNNLMPGRSHYGAVDQLLARELTMDLRYAEPIQRVRLEALPARRRATSRPPDTSTTRNPAVASNLIVDLTDGNPAAVAVAEAKEDVGAVIDPETGRIFIPNEAPDEGLSAPFNAWMTFFGQFFDHGLDLVNKGGSGTVVTPLCPTTRCGSSRRPRTRTRQTS